MVLQEFFLPVAIITTVLYLLLTLVLLKKAKKTKQYIEVISSNHSYVKKGMDGMTSKVDNIADEIRSNINPILKSVETEVKKLHCDFNLEVILEKIQQNGYANAKLTENGKIATIMQWNISDTDEAEYIYVFHLMTVDKESSSLLIESLSVCLEGEVSPEVYKDILEVNYSLKKSDFGIAQLSDNITAIFAQDYLVFPKNTFHIHPVTESLDDLERAFISLRNVLIEKQYPFIDLTPEYMENLKSQ